MADLAAIAERLDGAALEARAVPQLTELLTTAEAYEVQRLSVARRYARGEKRAGLKMGFTSRAKMNQMGLDEVIWGRLTDAMQIDDGGTLTLSRYVHPRVEPEVAFLLGESLSGCLTPLTVGAAVIAVAPALEVIDSRYENFKFSITDVIADNSSSSGFILGPWMAPSQVDVANLGLVMSLDGAPRQLGSSAAILGHPLRSLQAAARLALLNGEPLRPGDIVLAGGATAAEALRDVRHVRLEVEALGRAEFFVKP